MLFEMNPFQEKNGNMGQYFQRNFHGGREIAQEAGRQRFGHGLFGATFGTGARKRGSRRARCYQIRGSSSIDSKSPKTAPRHWRARTITVAPPLGSERRVPADQGFKNSLLRMSGVQVAFDSDAGMLKIVDQRIGRMSLPDVVMAKAEKRDGEESVDNASVMSL